MRLTSKETDMLGTYNAEIARGLVHTGEWKSQMAELQERWNIANETFYTMEIAVTCENGVIRGWNYDAYDDVIK